MCFCVVYKLCDSVLYVNMDEGSSVIYVVVLKTKNHIYKAITRLNTMKIHHISSIRYYMGVGHILGIALESPAQAGSMFPNSAATGLTQPHQHVWQIIFIMLWSLTAKKRSRHILWPRLCEGPTLQVSDPRQPGPESPVCVCVFSTDSCRFPRFFFQTKGCLLSPPPSQPIIFQLSDF